MKSDKSSASKEMDSIINKTIGWRGQKLSELRKIIISVDPNIIEEVKWKKPSRPEGVPVWSLNGIICVADTLKSSVRLTFPKGAFVRDPSRLFNTRLESKSVRAIDYYENNEINERALRLLILEIIENNK
jgi:hypothetical protein